MLTKNKGNSWGNVWGTLFGHWTPGFGVLWKTLVTMESKVLAHGLTGCRGDGKKHKERHQVRHLAPPHVAQNSSCVETCGKGEKWALAQAGATFLYFLGHKSKRKVKKC